MVMKMKHCDLCGVEVATPARLCPLCGAPLSGEEPGEAAYPAAGFGRGYHFIKRLLLFLTVMAVAVCAVVNLSVDPEFWWWAIVATVLAYAWAVGAHTLRHGGNGGGRVLTQVLAAAALVLLLDLETGWRGWSVDFVLPAICGVGIAAILVLILCNLTNWAGYVLYQIMLALLGFVPIALYFAGFAHVFWASAIPAVMALASLAALFFFGDRTIKNEFVRRLHL